MFVIWGGLFVILIFSFGMVFVVEVVRFIWLKCIYGLFVWVVVFFGVLMMMWSFFILFVVMGVVFFVLMLLLMWVMMVWNIVGVYLGVGLVLSFVIYLGLVVWSIGFVVYEFIFGFMVVCGI